jgi:acetyl-CoA acyltransferase
MKQLQDAYIVAATRSPIGKAPKGAFKNTRPDDLLATILQAAVAQVPSLDPALIEDAIVGCAIPEAQQGLNVARIGALLAGLPNTVGGITVNRFCASGLSAVAMAADRIRVGESDVMIAAGVESMSMVPMMGNSPSMSPSIFERDENRHCLRHGPDGREGGHAVEGQPRGPGRVLAGIAPEGRRRAAGWRIQGRDHPD